MTVVSVGNVPVVAASELPEGYVPAESYGRSTAVAIQLRFDGAPYWFAKVRLRLHDGRYYAPGWLVRLKKEAKR